VEVFRELCSVQPGAPEVGSPEYEEAVVADILRNQTLTHIEAMPEGEAKKQARAKVCKDHAEDGMFRLSFNEECLKNAKLHGIYSKMVHVYNPRFYVYT